MFGDILNFPCDCQLHHRKQEKMEDNSTSKPYCGFLTSRHIMIKSGIFQGDSLSPLPFYLTLAPLSSLINESTYGYHTQGHKITHLLYMDDLKMYAKNDNQQTGLLSTVKKFSAT